MNIFRTYFWDILKTQYFNFEGRAGRKQFWIYMSLLFVICVVLNFLSVADNWLGTAFAVLAGLLCLAVFVPTAAIGVRRLHDIDLPGWWILLFFVPVLGPVTLAVLWALPSSQGQNRFGLQQ